MVRANLIAELLRAQQVHLVNQVMENDQIARRFGLSLVESQMLHLLALRPDILTATAVVRCTGLPRSTVADVVDRLVTSGYLQRKRDTVDRRLVKLKLTDRAAEIGRHYATGSAAERAHVLMADLDEAELKTLLRYFDLLNSATEIEHQT